MGYLCLSCRGYFVWTFLLFVTLPGYSFALLLVDCGVSAWTLHSLLREAERLLSVYLSVHMNIDNVTRIYYYLALSALCAWKVGSTWQRGVR